MLCRDFSRHSRHFFGPRVAKATLFACKKLFEECNIVVKSTKLFSPHVRTNDQNHNWPIWACGSAVWLKKSYLLGLSIIMNLIYRWARHIKITYSKSNSLDRKCRKRHSLDKYKQRAMTAFFLYFFANISV